MDDVLIETQSGRIRSGLVDELLLTSQGRPWNGFFLKETGTSDVEAQDIMLLKYAVCLQVSRPAELDWRGDGQFITKTVFPGQILICPANRLYSIRYKHAGAAIVLLLEPEFLANALDNGTQPSDLSLRWEMGADAPALRELLLLLRNETVRSAAGDAHYATTIAKLIAIHLVQHYSEQRDDPARRGGLSPTRLRKVVSVIEERLDGELSLDELAQAAGLSVFHFSRVFRQSTGMSPFQYVTKARVERARTLLLEPGMRIGEVALECGFCDQAHLTRHFKRVTGVTPAVFVRSVGYRSFSR